LTNGGVLAGTVQNYTKDFDFMWDEPTIPTTYDSYLKEAAAKILDIVKKETVLVGESAKRTMEKIEGNTISSSVA
jgi:hypothetical protein